jgi:hypothetical protein
VTASLFIVKCFHFQTYRCHYFWNSSFLETQERTNIRTLSCLRVSTAISYRLWSFYFAGSRDEVFIHEGGLPNLVEFKQQTPKENSRKYIVWKIREKCLLINILPVIYLIYEPIKRKVIFVGWNFKALCLTYHTHTDLNLWLRNFV